MTTQTVVITGANSGIGLQASWHFARSGARVIMACRNSEKAEQAKNQILSTTPDANLVIIPLDVADLTSVHAFAGQVTDRCGPLDLLINNAGIVAMPLTRNSAGHESQLATNYLGAFALTGLLLPLFNPDLPSRIVNVGSLAHRLGTLNLDDLNWQQTPYHEWKAYANSKVAMLSFTLELNRRLQASGSRTLALAAHPGFANTNIHQNSPALTNTHPLRKWFQNKMQRFVPSAEDAARSIITAATAADARGGEYYGPRGWLEIGGKPTNKARLNPQATSQDTAKQLWQLSETMTEVYYLSTP